MTAVAHKRVNQIMLMFNLLTLAGVVFSAGPLAGVIARVTGLSADFVAIALQITGGLLAAWCIHLIMDHNWRALVSVVSYVIVIGGILLLALTIFAGGTGGALIG